MPEYKQIILEKNGMQVSAWIDIKLASIYFAGFTNIAAEIDFHIAPHDVNRMQSIVKYRQESGESITLRTPEEHERRNIPIHLLHECR